MRVGFDGSKWPGADKNGPLWTLERAVEHGADGVFFRSILALSPTLDHGQIADVASFARQHGLYLEAGIGRVNPYSSPESPEVRALGDGDYILGMRRMIEAAATAGITELWTCTANLQYGLRGLLACDRFRTDVTWEEQLRASACVLELLGPVLRHHGAHLNIETHEEITSFEAVRLVENAGPDAFGITFDIGNVVARGEHPTAAAKRVAPYTRQTHVRDVGFCRAADGFGRFVLPVGQGVVDWGAVLTELYRESPDATLSVESMGANPGFTGENAGREMVLRTNDPRWLASSADLTREELASVLELADTYERLALEGSVPNEEALRSPTSEEQAEAFLCDSMSELRRQLAPVEAVTV